MITESVLTLIVSILSVDQGIATIDQGRFAGLRPGDTGGIYYQLTVGAETKRIDVGEGALIEVDDSRSTLRAAHDVSLRSGYFVEFEIPMSVVSAGLAAAGRAAELLERVAELEAEVAKSQAGKVELRGQLRQTESRLEQAEIDGQKLQHELALARSEVSRLETLEQRAETTMVASSADVPRAATPPDPATEVLAAIGDWALAWSEQRVDDYLAFYARDFRPPGGKTRSQWEAHRRPRVLEPRFIEVKLENLEVLSVDRGRAEVKLRQHYRSDTHRVAAIKLLELVQDDGEWKIAIERIE